jgi:hypothetical protein
MVCRARHRGPGVGCHHLHQEPRPVVGRRSGEPVPSRRCCRKTGSRGCCRSITSRLTACCWRPGRARSAFARRAAWASRPARRNSKQDFHGERRTNDTRASTTDGGRRINNGRSSSRVCAAAMVSDVAGRVDISSGQIERWRQKTRDTDLRFHAGSRGDLSPSFSYQEIVERVHSIIFM